MSCTSDWKRDFYIWLPLMLLSWWLAWKFQDEFITDWDGFDYTAYTVSGWPSALGLGRSLFIGYNYILWKIAHHYFNLPLEQAHLVLRYGVIAQSGPAIVGFYALCKELTMSRLAALFSALIVAASPFYIIYSGRPMSEIPALLLMSWSLWWMLRSLRLGRTNRFLIAAYLVGLSANIREFAIFYFPLIPLAAWLCRRNWRLGLKGLALAIFGAFAGIIFWTIFKPEFYWPAAIKWYTLSANERSIHPVTIDNLRFFARFAFSCSPTIAIMTPLALISLYSVSRLRVLFVLGCLGLTANLALLANHDLPVNPRYLLTGLPGLAAIAGWSLTELIKSHRVWATPLLIGLVVLTKGSYNYMAKELYDQEWAARAARDYVAKIEKLPWHSAFIVGSRTPLVNFYYWSGARPYWKTISPGAGWPDEKLDKAIDDLLDAGRSVYVDFDPELWLVGLREESREGRGLEMIKRLYKLEHIHSSFYRIIEKRTAQDEKPAGHSPGRVATS
jgi:Dolichyl-phosphate-mannose-protein mannosyltransferase